MNWLSFFMGAGAVILIEWLIFTTLVIKAAIRKANNKKKEGQQNGKSLFM